MSSVPKEMERARMNGRHHNGMAARVREVLASSAEPLTLDAIGLRSGLRIESVRRTISTMISLTGGVVSVRTGRGVAYRLFRQAPAPSRAPRGVVVAAPITIGRGSLWGVDW